MPFITTAAIVGAGIAGLGGAALSAHAAGKAADAQMSAADRAAELQHEDAQSALAENKRQYDTNQANLAPWLKAGQGAIGQLSGMLNDGTFKDWNENFQAPTNVTEQNDPGYQFRMQQGQQAIERSAAARGGVLSGGTAKALDQYNQDYASNEYGNVYNRAYNEYATRYNQFETNQTNKYNRFAGVAGVGQQAANQLGILGNQSAQNAGNIYMQSGQQIGNDYMQAGAARASGYIGGANAWNGAFNNLSALAMLYGNSNQGNNDQSWMLGPHG